MTTNSLPLLFTFDGQARSGKGTVVHAVKRSLQNRGIKTMLIDAGQVFRVLVVSAGHHGVDMESPDAIDAFLNDDAMLHETTELVKKVYAMPHDERDALLYTLKVGENSAKIGARPKSQEFKDGLLRKWLTDAVHEGYEVVLLDGRALEEVGSMLDAEGYCVYDMGLYFVCQAEIGARRTLGFAARSYDELTDKERRQVDALITQIDARNRSDAERKVQPIVPPENAPVCLLPEFEFTYHPGERQMLIIDTSAELTKNDMVSPVVRMFDSLLQPVH